ncbi:nucleoside phosphorylase [Mangrovimonas aestuarii]|uniref:nucleoside phosphorylase n=1 Tax=Mangrovimonas aestuarii TaxID=3018443 RepID=UPI002378BE16|nr:nucleoside phosphorylase [Mangrovimonas aestuarii]
MAFKPSELILNPDGSVYHLNLKPEHIAKTVITVGDPDRVEEVSKYFDTIEFKIQKREFHTHTGYYKGKHITVISTGIGTDNIDIVLNELDALVNIDLPTRTVRPELTSLEIIRIGTSGAIQDDIPVDSFFVSEFSVGFDSLLHYYENKNVLHADFSEALMEHCNWSPQKSKPYFVKSDESLFNRFTSQKTVEGITATNVGFYGPQGRTLRLNLQDDTLNDKIASFKFRGHCISNLEMETAGIYGLAELLGHKAVSLSAIIANRVTGQFSSNPKAVVNNLIIYTLNKLIE